MRQPNRVNPFEFLFLLAYFLYCVVALAAFNTVATTTLRSYGHGWSAALLFVSVLGTGLALTGMLLREPRGLLLERAGLFSVAAPCAVYGVLGLTTNGARSLGFCLLLLALAVSSTWRIFQIARALKFAKDVTR
jgi:hypothetical protein